MSNLRDITNIESRSDIRLYHGECLETIDRLIEQGLQNAK